MICPKCGAEYRRGFSSCADCHVLLVEEGSAAKREHRQAWSTKTRETALSEGENDDSRGEAAESGPAKQAGDPNSDPFCSFWKGTDLRVCTEVCTVLDEAEIPHKTIRRQDHLFNLNHQAPYEVGVPASLYEKAEHAIRNAFGEADEGSRLLGHGSEASMQELADMPLREKWKQRPEEEIPTFLESVFWKKKGEVAEKPEQHNDSRKANPSEWYPQDATAPVWDGEPPDAREMIELALAENDIRMRWEEHGGKASVHVLPEDEERAKEIVREVVTGEPAGEQEEQESEEDRNA